jgi:serine hydrolase
MRPVLTVPGIQNSGPAHWQSRWEALHAGVTRVQQRDWDHPVCDEWVAALDDAVRRAAQPPIVVAHSLGCLVAARWAASSPLPVHALLLVAVPDPAGPEFPREALGFERLPATLPGRRVRMISSADDPYASPAYSAERAAAWSAEHLGLGERGHLNAASGLGDWAQAWAWVEAWRAEG